MSFQKNGKITGNDLLTILPLAIDWVEKFSEKVCTEGRVLTQEEQRLAREVGVSNPEKIRVWFFKDFPYPTNPILKSAVETTGLLGPGMLGLTLGHGICIAEDQLTDRLLSHECRHVHQYEKFGSIASFLSEYLNQIIEYGYYFAPLEVDARNHEVQE